MLRRLSIAAYIVMPSLIVAGVYLLANLRAKPDKSYPAAAWSEANIRLSMERGNAIAAALERYRSAFGEYPQSLSKLDRIDYSFARPDAGEPHWFYTVTSESFVLGFGTDFYPRNQYQWPKLSSMSQYRWRTAISITWRTDGDRFDILDK